MATLEQTTAALQRSISVANDQNADQQKRAQAKALAKQLASALKSMRQDQSQNKGGDKLAQGGDNSPQQPPTAMQDIKKGFANIAGAVEPVATMATGAIATPFAGIAGIAGLPFGADQASKNVAATMDFMTHKPMTDYGKQANQGLGKLFTPVGEALDVAKSVTADPVADFLGENVSPEVGAAAGAFIVTLPEAVAQRLGIRGLKSKRGARQVTGISDDAIDSLNAQGIDIDDLSDTGVAKVQEAVNADAKARAARFKDLDVEPTTGDLSQLSVDKAAEARALEVSSAPGREGLVARRIKQSDTLGLRLEELQRTLGNADEVGDSAKAAAQGLKKELRDKKTDLYNRFAEESPELANIPVDATPIRATMPDGDGLIDLATAVGETEVQSVLDIMTKYGVIDDAASVKKYLSETTLGQPNEITQLNAANHDRFRKAINRVTKRHPDVSALTGPIKSALDGEVNFISDALVRAGASDSAIDTIKQARDAVTDLKTAFDPSSAAERIIKKKRGSRAPMVEVSKVFDEVAKANKPVEHIERLFKVFDRAGPSGQKAIGNFQAKVVQDLIDGAFSAKSRNIDGRQLIARAGYDRVVKSIGKDKIEVIFKGNKKALERLDDISKTLDDITPSGFEVPKGSGNVILDVLEKVGVNTIAAKIPGARETLFVFKDIAGKGRDAKIIENALKGTPKQKKLAFKRLDTMQQQMPHLYKALAIGSLVGPRDSEQDADERK